MFQRTHGCREFSQESVSISATNGCTFIAIDFTLLLEADSTWYQQYQEKEEASKFVARFELFYVCIVISYQTGRES